MPSTHDNLLMNAIFATKNRIKWTSDDRQAALFGYIGSANATFNGGAVSFDSQGCKPLTGRPKAEEESRSDGIGSTGRYPTP
jgi:hypothetical protein